MHDEIIMLYDKYSKLRNASVFKPLTHEVFNSYGIYTFNDLTQYLKLKSEYGGAVKLGNSNGLVLLPFHNDTLNKWLKFKNPRVKQAYDLVFNQFGARYSDRNDFERDRFNVEETLLKECWSMPAMDTRFLDAPIAGCWDKMEIQACFLRILGYKVKRYCFHSGNIMRGHTFILFNDGKTWNTTLSFPLHFRRNKLQSLCRFVFNILRYVPILDKGEISELIEFSPPYEGMSTSSYIKLIKSGTIVLRW